MNVKKNQTRIISALIIGLLALSHPSAAQELKIGFLDAQKVLSQTKEGTRIRETLDAFVKARQEIIDLDERELKRMKDELDQQGILLSKEALSLKQNEMEEAFGRYQRKASELKKEVQEKQLSSLNAFNQKMEQATREVAEKEGYGFVLDKNGERGAVIYGKESFNLTAKIIEQMDKHLSKENTKESGKEIKK
jgi:outer membrane protein